MTGAILMKQVPATTMRSASRGVPRITSAPKRETSYLLVMLVAISTKQQERPKWKGQMEFFRPQAIKSSRRERMTLRRTCVSRGPFEEPSRSELASTRLVDHCMKRRPLIIPLESSGAPIERAHSPEISECSEQNGDENRYFDIAGPAGFADGNGPSKDKDRFEIED